MSIANPNDEKRHASRQLDPDVLRFLSQLAHELRTPLTGVKGSIGVVLANEPSGTSDPLRRMFQTIDAAADRMEHMIGNISELVRMQGGQIELAREQCDLEELIRRVVDQTSADGQLRGRPIELELPAKSVLANVDRGRTERAVRNLLAAAIKLLGVEGAITITLTSEQSDAVITVTAELARPSDGKDAPPLDRTASEERISLELAVASAIVQRHGGFVSVLSTAAGGMALRLAVPLNGSAAVDEANAVRSISA